MLIRLVAPVNVGVGDNERDYLCYCFPPTQSGQLVVERFRHFRPVMVKGLAPMEVTNNIILYNYFQPETQAAVDELLLEVLEHLPQTVMGFEGEMKTCSAVFEPETVISRHNGTVGPLSVALGKRQQMDTYCTIPLVLDFMWRKFTKGLPSLRDTEGVLENNKKFSNPGHTLYG